MSNTDLIIEERSRDIGDFLVGRLIPFRKKRMVGPFIFIDHMGPAKLGPDKYMDVDQHPHIGLSTLTYLMEGSIMHEDSLGTRQLIEPGSVNWMVSGSGCSHTERTPDQLRQDKVEFTMHGYQIWVALPKELENASPEFHHIDANELPNWEDGAAKFTLVAGTGYGKTSPVPVHSPLFMIDIKTTADYDLCIADNLKGEVGVTIVEGGVIACDKAVSAGNMLVSKTENVCNLTIKANSHILLFGGEPLPEQRFIHWNFVSSSKDKIEEAKQAWRNKTFPMMDNDDSYVPLPGS